MYPEFIAIYVGLAVIFALLVVVLVLLAVVLAKLGKGRSASRSNYTQSTAGGNLAFCKNCATQFNASQRCCPKCGTPR